MTPPKRDENDLTPLVFEDGTVLPVYPSLESAFPSLPATGWERMEAQLQQQKDNESQSQNQNT